MRKLSALLLSLFIANFSFAQGNFGIKTGTNLHYIKSSTTETENFDNPRLGFIIGGSYDMPVSSTFSIQPELLVSAQETVETYYMNRLKTTYVLLPVLFKYNIAASNFNLYAGPQLGFLSSAKRKMSGENVDVKDQLNKTDMGATAGVGYLFPKCRITSEVRYSFGTLNVLQDQSSGTKTRNRLWSVMIGYSFAKKK